MCLWSTYFQQECHEHSVGEISLFNTCCWDNWKASHCQKKFLTLLVFTQRLILVNSWTYMLQKWFYMCIYLHIWIYIVFTLLCSDCVFHLWNDVISSNNSFYLYTTFYGPGNSLSSLGILTWCNSHTNPLSAITVQISGWWGMWN